MHRRFALVAALALLGTGCGLNGTEPSAAPGVDPGASTPPSTVPTPPGESARLLRVLDGDSFKVEVAGATTEVRLVGINAPERDECHGDAARDALDALLTDATITLVSTEEDDHDRFGRLLRYVYADGVPVAEQMINDGHANVLQGDHERDDQFVGLADAAAAAGRGLWQSDACGPSNPAPISIVGVEYDPPGPDRDTAADEFVIIRNAGTESVDLTDWIVRDESSQHRYLLTAITVAAGGELRIRSGCGTDDTHDLYWCAGDAVWSNGGDTVLLQDPSGNVVDRLLYRGDY